MSQARNRSFKGNFRDLMLILFENYGTIKKTVVFSNGNISKDLYLTNNALINLDGDQYFFAGQSIGYQTTLQKLTYAKNGKTGKLND